MTHSTIALFQNILKIYLQELQLQIATDLKGEPVLALRIVEIIDRAIASADTKLRDVGSEVGNGG